ncbi:MAG: tetratricopeptide repeat protein, partial [Anaerolineae bacterium]
SALEKAHKLAPGESKYTRTLALALERTASATSSRTEQKERQQRAIDLWEALLDDSASPVQLRREARQRIVALWRGQGELVRRQKHLVSRFRRTPPDLEAGRLLGEVQLKLRQYGGAEKTLRQVVAHAPGDVESLLRLERVLALQGKHRGALEVLERLVTADPKRSRDYYERMVRHAAELYEDELAIKYALRVVQLSPEDAEGYRRLGEMYLRRQQTARAVEAFRNAISRNDRLFSVHFELAELLVDQGKVDEADQLLRRIVRASPDDSLVTQAARLSMQINVSRGQLETLERELLPIALSNPTKPIYRRLLVDLYSAMAFPLVQAAHAKDLERAKAAREKLSSIGERAVKPLLDALGDTRDTQQGVAVELLGHIKNRSAGPALLAYATGPGVATLRTRAMVAVGGLADPELLPQLIAKNLGRD